MTHASQNLELILFGWVDALRRRDPDRIADHTVKEVVGMLAVNPNTMLKAYRELELEGLVEGRQGLGTFVVRTWGAPPPDCLRVRHGLERWLRDARAWS